MITYLRIEDEQKHRATYDCLMVLKMLRALEETDCKKSESKGLLSSSNEKKERLKLVEKYVADGLDVESIAKNLYISKGTAENYIVELLKAGKIDATAYINSEEEIMNALALIGEWDGKLKSIKEMLDDRISYFEIKIVLAKNNLL